MLRTLVAPVVLIGLLLSSAPLLGQDGNGLSDDVEAEGTPFFKPGGIWIRGGFGSFDANPDPQLPGQRGHTTFMVSAGGELSDAPFLSLEFEIVSTMRTYDTEGGSLIFLTVGDETSVESSAITLGGRILLPPSSPVRVYATGGLAYVHTRFKTGGSVFFIPTTTQEQSDGSVRPVFGVGAQVVFGQWSIHADYRSFSLTGSFPEYGVDEVDLGGSMIAFGVGWRPTFGR